MKKSITLIASLFILLLTASAQDLSQNMQEKYSPYFDGQGINGVALASKDGVSESFAIGASRDGEVWDEHTVFNIGSATKTMTSVLILQEVQKGKMSLDDPLSKYLEELPNVDGTLTLEELLRHESGLGELVGANYLEIAFGDEPIPTSDELILTIPVPHDDKSERYTNTNYILLGKVLESATGKTYFDLLEERIFAPAGMKESHPFLSKGIPGIAPPHHEGNAVIDSVNFEMYKDFAYSAGSVASTLSDMSKFYESLYSSDRLIDREHFEFMTTSHADTSEMIRYGLGLMMVDHDEFQYYSHGGDNIGYSFRNYYDVANGDHVLVFGNEYMFEFNYEVQSDLLGHIKGRDFVKGESLTADEFDLVIGDFVAAAIDFNFSVKNRDGLPYIDAMGSPRGLLIEGDTLYNKMIDFRIVMDSLEQGSVAISFNGNECRAYRPDMIPQEFLTEDQADLTKYGSFHGTFVLTDIGLELELKGNEKEMFLVAQGTELQLKENDENTLTCTMMGVDLDFDFADSTSFLFKQAGQEFTATRKE